MLVCAAVISPSDPYIVKRGLNSPFDRLAELFNCQVRGICCGCICIVWHLQIMAHQVRLGESLKGDTAGFFEQERKMKILIVGGGGREHALAWSISASPCAMI